MSNMISNIGGVISNVFDTKKMQEWQNYFQQWTMTGDDRLNCYGIDANNIEAEQWFQENIFSKVKKVLGNDRMCSIFGMYTESVKPYIIHSDEYHVEKNNIHGEPFMSWLIPYKVDGKQQNIFRASTIVFNETGFDEDKYTITDSLREKYFTHCDQRLLNKVSVNKIIHWEPGSLIYWDQRYLHCSGSFNNFSTKEMFVGHTFMPY